VFWYRVPDLSVGNQKSLANDGDSLTGGTTSRLVPTERSVRQSWTSEVQPQVLGCVTMENYVRQHGYFELDTHWYTQPM